VIKTRCKTQFASVAPCLQLLLPLLLPLLLLQLPEHQQVRSASRDSSAQDDAVCQTAEASAGKFQGLEFVVKCKYHGVESAAL
jgi:hypothetical protein